MHQSGTDSSTHEVLVIDCHIFSQVEPNTKLFPAVFVLPSNQNVIQFELGKLKVSRSKLIYD